MAVVVRSRRLINSGKARKFRASGGRAIAKAKSYRAKSIKAYTMSKTHKPKAKKKLSPKQIAFFGTPRQKAALRAARSRKRLSNGQARRSVKAIKKQVGGSSRTLKTQIKSMRSGYQYKQAVKRLHKNRKRNIGEIVSISLAGLNPGKKRNSGMAKRRKATAHKHRVVRRRVVARRRKGTTSMKRRRRNPVYRVKRVARRRNAGTPRMLSGVLGKAVGIIGGAVATRYATQMLLGGNNVGVMGYLGNAVSAFALGWGTGKLAGKEMGTNVMIGGFVSTILRVITDQTSLGKYINLSLNGMGKGGDIGMGIIQDSSFSLPQVNVPGSQTQFITPRGTRQYVSSQIDAVRAAVAPKPAMGNVFGGQQRRRVM